MATSTMNVLITLVVLAPTMLKALEYIKARVKNERIESAINFAEMIVQSIGEANSVLTVGQRQQAITQLENRLKANGIVKHFTNAELATYIDQAATFVDSETK